MKMISKSLSFPSSKPDGAKVHKTFNFAHYYKSTAETNTNVEKDPIGNCNDSNETSSLPKPLNKISKRNGKNHAIPMTTIDIDGQTLVPKSRQVSPSGSKITSTPKMAKNRNLNVKSIMRDSPSLENSLDLSSVPKLNRKKRNKSVSFMLDENTEVVVKKTKSHESLTQKTEEPKPKMKNKRYKKTQKEDKENNNNESPNGTKDSDCNNEINKTKTKKNKRAKAETHNDFDVINISTSITSKKENNTSVTNCKMTGIDVPVQEKPDVKKKRRKHNKVSKNSDKASTTVTGGASENTDQNDVVTIKKSKRSKKNKHHVDVSEMDEPEKKTVKRNKADNIAEAIENLNIGDNTHTLTNLLDGMTVTKTNKNEKTKANHISHPELKSDENSKKNRNSRKRRNRQMHASVIVQNLPFRILLSFKKKLRDFFSKYGTVQSVGLADLKCGPEDAQPIFTTRVFFTTEEEAIAALEGDKELYEGNIIRVKKLSAQVTRIFRPSNKNRMPIEAKAKTIKEGSKCCDEKNLI